MLQLDAVIEWLLSGQGLVTILIIWLFLETLVIITKNGKFVFGKFSKDEGNIADQVHQYSSKALNLSALTFAAITFLISGVGLEITKVADPLIIFVFGFFCFIISYKLSIFGATRRIYWSMQQRLLNFGLLSLVFGLLIFFIKQLPQVNILIISMTIIAVFFHLKEYYSDYKYYTNMKSEKKTK